MIKNYTLKLGALALAQESKKGFPQGIPEIAKPYMEANDIAEEDLIPQEYQEQEEGMQYEQAENPMMQQMEGANEAPMQMPNGQPVAMPQEMEEMSPEMMQGAPMAQYGAEMGGYNMPFYDAPDEMAYGGSLYKAQVGVTTGKTTASTSGRGLSKEELQERQKKQEKIRTQKGKAGLEGYTDIGDNVYAKGTISQGQAPNSSLGNAKPGTGAPNAAWRKTICDQLSKGVPVEQLAKKDAKGNSHGTVAGLTAQFADCIKKGKEAVSTGKEEVDFVKLEDEPGTEECECTRQDGTKYKGDKNLDGSCKDCEETVPGSYKSTTVTTPEKQPAEWWLQDTVNTMGAFGDMMRTKKYMPWEARVDLEEPRPTFLDPTRELAAQSEQANIASQAAASFAGPQALNARLSQIQGQGAKGAADTLSKINNQNVNIANQFEANQVGVRNQENMLNQQMANRVYDKNVVANQQFDNAKTAGRANMRQAYNTALTNKAKTDAMNQMYPNYQVDPSTGGMVNYKATDKKLDKSAQDADIFKYRNDLKKAGWTDKEIIAEMARKFGKQFGGQTFEHGGFVYTVFPAVTL
jgi:hypothetical protein